MANSIDEFTVRSGDQEAIGTIYGLQRHDKVIFYASYTIRRKASKNIASKQGPFELFQPWDGIVLSQFKEYVEEHIREVMTKKVGELVTSEK